jgi:branched-chain amino acid transport system ATP-binding protein
MEASRGRADHGGDRRRLADEILERVGLQAVADRQADTLPTGIARRVELGRALATRPRLLLLDEPSSGLDQPETDALGRLLASLAAEGMAVLLVEHDVELVMRVCSRVHVLDFGQIIAVGNPSEVQADPRVQLAYLGVEAGKERLRQGSGAEASG